MKKHVEFAFQQTSLITDVFICENGVLTPYTSSVFFAIISTDQLIVWASFACSGFKFSVFIRAQSIAQKKRKKINHSATEDRIIVIGKVDKVLFVVYTERGDKIWIISARAATKAERKLYGNSYIGFIR